MGRIVASDNVSLDGVILDPADDRASCVAGAKDGLVVEVMHKAKGLDACVVFVPAAEEEFYIRDATGRNEARRLFYGSITRARHALFISHAISRTGKQARLGTNVRGPRQRTSSYSREAPRDRERRSRGGSSSSHPWWGRSQAPTR